MSKYKKRSVLWFCYQMGILIGDVLRIILPQKQRKVLLERLGQWERYNE